MDEEKLKTSLDTYKLQATQIEAALNVSSEENHGALSQLLQDMKELVSLTEESLLSLKKSKLLALVDSHKTTQSNHVNSSAGMPQSSMDAEFAAFQAAVANTDVAESTLDTAPQHTTQGSQGTSISAGQQGNVECPCPPPGNHDAVDTGGGGTDSDNTIDVSLEEIIGTKCRAPFHHEWGTFQYHNCMVINVPDLDEDSHPKVKVLCCNPTHRSLVPCPYYLDGKCKFPDENCRYSHGHSVNVEDLQEFQDPDYSKLKIDTDCLAKDSDGVWYKAKVIEICENHAFGVMFECDDTTTTVDIENIIPAGYEDTQEAEDDSHTLLSDTDSDQSDDELPVYLWQPGMDATGMGEWEVHTRGIASKLMSKMGYIAGQGLGKNSEGRTEPVPIQLLPSGKSLDKIMELKAIAGDQNLYDVMKKQKHKQSKIDKKSAGRYQAVPTDKTSVFDFINKKLGNKKGNVHDLVKNDKHHKKTTSQHISESDLKDKSDRQINVQMLRTHEEIRSVEKEVTRLKAGLLRNEGRDHAVASQLEKKISSMEAYLLQLQSSEKSLQGHRQSRSDHKKLTIF